MHFPVLVVVAVMGF